MRENNTKSPFIVLIFPMEKGNTKEFFEFSKRVKEALLTSCEDDLNLIFPSMSMLSLLVHGNIETISNSLELIRPSDCRMLVCEIGSVHAQSGLSNSSLWIEAHTSLLQKEISNKDFH